MSKIRLVEQASAPGTPGTNEVLLYVDSSSQLATKNDAGTVRTVPAVEANNTYSGTTTFNGKTVLGPDSTLTVSGGVITVTGTYHKVETEGLAATDDLDTINGGVAGQLLVLGSVANTRDTTVKHGTGNIYLDGTTDFALSGTRDKLMLIYSGTEWHEVGHGNNV